MDLVDALVAEGVAVAWEFGLIDRNVSTWVQVEARFDIQLEGDAVIRFSP